MGKDLLLHMYTIIVINIDSEPHRLIKLYCKKGEMENFWLLFKKPIN